MCMVVIGHGRYGRQELSSWEENHEHLKHHKETNNNLRNAAFSLTRKSLNVHLLKFVGMWSNKHPVVDRGLWISNFQLLFGAKTNRQGVTLGVCCCCYKSPCTWTRFPARKFNTWISLNSARRQQVRFITSSRGLQDFATFTEINKTNDGRLKCKCYVFPQGISRAPFPYMCDISWPSNSSDEILDELLADLVFLYAFWCSF